MSNKQWGTRQTCLWFCLAILTPIYFGIISVYPAFDHEFIVAADTRLHVTWLQQLIDPQVFANDLSATYYQAFLPAGFKWLYGVAAQGGIEPLELAKVLPIPLGIIASVYFFGVCFEIFPSVVGAGIATLIFNQNLWFQNDLITSTPRAFGDPLFAAFLYYLLKRQPFPCLGIVLLQGLFYPVLVPVEVGILIAGLVRWQGFIPRVSRERLDYGLALGGVAIALIILAPSLLSPSDYGPVYTVEQMRGMAEFYPGGRTPYFGIHPLAFWTVGRSGVRIPFLPPILLLGLLLPLLSKAKFPLIAAVTPKQRILVQILLPSLGLYSLAHLLLLRLYWPSRYTYFSFRFILAISAGIVVTSFCEAGLRKVQQTWRTQTQFTVSQVGMMASLMLFGAVALITPALPPVLWASHHWRIGTEPSLYAFLASQPQDIVVASLSQQADNLPSFTHRSVLVSRAAITAFHVNYYQQLYQRLTDLVTAQYSSDLKSVKQFIRTYSIDFWLLDQTAFSSDYAEQNRWLLQYQAIIAPAMARLAQGQTPALIRYIPLCSSLSSKNVTLLNASCLLSQPDSS